ncbi:NADPH-dependent F420 reductase [Nocardia jinanensis]|uniref:NADP oxidoreductase n=1 Tax=Nocardia jinanensis TaxID=382504 RepID=A0A917VY97_9NOCA|nr:NAD(P)-binding domain-containing protein [Nocardia jinanensis]GGL35666.1 NADP oxidoreductase [Nocardia jinanensis]
MRIAILGTGHLAEALGACWVRAGHQVTLAGRTPEKAAALARRLGGPTRSETAREAVRDANAVLLAVPWDAVGAVVEAAGGAGGSLAGIPIIDPTNPVGHGVGVVLNPPGLSNADRIAGAAPGGRVVKGFHLVPSTQWGSADAATTVLLCGDEPAALQVAETLVRDAGAVPVVVGTLARARQLEEAAGLFIALAFAGVDPRTVAPALPPVRP